MKTKFLFIALFFASINLFGQEDRIDAQRPTLAESYSIIKGNTIQVESGLQYDFDASELSASTFVRHSFFNLVELRIAQGITSNDFAYSAKVLALNGENSLGLGASFIYTNDGNDDYKIILTKEFNRLSITFNTGWNDELLGGRYNNLHFGYLLYPDWSIFVEGQSIGTNDTNFDNSLQGGIVFLPSDNVQIDSFIGYNENNGIYAGAGLSFRINYGKKENYIIEELY